MAAPKTIKNLAGDTPSAARLSYTPPTSPPDPGSLEQTILQLQNSLNEAHKKVNDLIADFNTHVHSGVTAGGANSGAKTSAAKAAIDGTAQTAQNVFTAS